MRKPRPVWLLPGLLAGWIVGLPSARAEAPAPATGQVVEVRVEGTQRIEPAAILAEVDLKVGDSLTSWMVQQDLRSVYRTGLVDDVRVDVSPAAGGGGVVVTFHVKEKPAIRNIRISGNKKIKEDDILEVVDIPTFAVLNDSEVASNVQRIRDLYVEKGYYLAEVEPEIKSITEDQVELTFRVTENRKVQVARIDITGNENVTDRKVRKYMQTRAGGALAWLSNKGTFKKENLDNDVFVVRSVYLEEGYVDVQVEPPKVYLSPDKRHIYVSIHVTEGLRYRIGAVSMKGDYVPEEGLTAESVQRLIDGDSLDDVEYDNHQALGEAVAYIKSPPAANPQGGPTSGPDSALETGQWFKLTRLQGVMQKITDLYSDQGYAFANVVPLTDTDPERRIVDVSFDIQRGEKVSIGRINITGNDPTFDKVVRREIPLNEGDWYSGRAIQDAKGRLQRLGFFEEVRISTPRGAADDVLDMNVEVTEQPTGSVSAGAGFSNLENFVLTLNVSKNNFLGLGYVMSAAINASQKRQQGNLSFFDPYFLDSRWTLQFSGYSLNQNFIEDEFQKGGSVAIGRYLDPRDDLRLTMNYAVENSGLSYIDAYKLRLLGGDLYRSGLTSTLGLNFNIDKRNNRIQATRGLYVNLSTDLSGGFEIGNDKVLSLVGGEFNLWESKFNLRYFKPVSPKGEWLIFRYNGTLGRIQTTDGSVVPYIHRYRAGGINSVRGFDWYSLGPSIRAMGYQEGQRSFIGSDDPTMADDRLVVGGTEIWVNNFELESPFLKAAGISGVLFFDAGNAYGDPWGAGHIDPLDLRTSVGGGVRWFSPMGPLRFEIGFPLVPQEGERRAVFDFSMGSFF